MPVTSLYQFSGPGKHMLDVTAALPRDGKKALSTMAAFLETMEILNPESATFKKDTRAILRHSTIENVNDTTSYLIVESEKFQKSAKNIFARFYTGAAPYFYINRHTLTRVSPNP